MPQCNLARCKTMKKIMAILILIGLCCLAGYYEHNYTREVEVINVQGCDVTVADNYGHEWKFFGDGYKVGEIITVRMNTNCTTNTVIDDEITGVLH